MAHMVFVETTRPATRALDHALAMGHEVTLIRSGRFDWLLPPAEHERIRALDIRRVEIADTRSDALIETALHDLMALGPVDAVLTALQPVATPAAIAAGRLGIRATAARGMINARDKALTRAALDRAGLPSVAHATVRTLEDALNAADRIGYPVIVKPVNGLGKALTTWANRPDDIHRHFATLGGRRELLQTGLSDELADAAFIIEEIARGPLHSLELAGLASGAKVPLILVRRKTGRDDPVLEMGSTVPAPLSAEDRRAAGDYAVAVAEALGLDIGIFHIELIMTDRGPRLVEVNPRIAGGAIPDLIRTATGVDPFELLVRVHAGESPVSDWLPETCAASHSFITMAEDCTVRADLAPDWFEAFRPRMASGGCDIRPGASYRRMDGNQDVLGVVRMVAPTIGEAAAACEALRAEIAETLGVKLVELVE